MTIGSIEHRATCRDARLETFEAVRPGRVDWRAGLGGSIQVARSSSETVLVERCCACGAQRVSAAVVELPVEQAELLTAAGWQPPSPKKPRPR